MIALLAALAAVLVIALVIAGRALLVARAGQATAEQELAAVQAASAAAERHAAQLREHDADAHRRQLESLERATEEKLALVAGNRDDLTKEMHAITAEVLKGATEQVARVAEEARRADRETTSGELKARAAEIKAAVEPIGEHLKKVQEQVRHLEVERSNTKGTVEQLFSRMTSELGQLRTETGALVSALKRPQVRGSWGEMQLRNVARIAGMTDHVDFHDQATIAGDEAQGALRPDMTVHMPTGRDVVVDSKVPLDAYLAALEASDEATRDAELVRHARQVRAHLDTLAGKAYHARLDRSAEFVVCFIPNEACYVAALDRDPSLLEHGASKGVLIATPTTLLALLHATHYGWRQAEVEASAQEIAAAGRELHKRCATFLGSFNTVGKRLASATTAYNDAVGSLESRVLPQLRRIEDHGARSEKELVAAAGIDVAARPLTAPELTVAEIEVGVSDRALR